MPLPLIILIILGAILLWFILSFLYKPIGKFFGGLFDDSVNAMSEDQEEEEKKDE